MKHIFLKSICLASSISFALPLFSCSQEKKSEYITEIDASFYNQVLELTCSRQIKNKTLWRRFVNVFREKEDTAQAMGGTWRGEFWGKMMRGAVLCYKYSHDEELYNILTETVKELLTSQEANGRISSYSLEQEFSNWDLWGRKYLITALIHYYGICKDKEFKKEILESLKKQANYILDKVGDGPNKKNILDCGGNIGNIQGLNACTILEPMVNLYELTNDGKYLDFASYIISTGGSKAGNMVECMKLGTINPADFPIRKAYETLSFFEGVYRFAKVVKDDALLRSVIKFFDKVYDCEVTVIGAAGYAEELFNNGAENQIVQHNKDTEGDRFGLETCVTVTWMRILSVLYEDTHDVKYYERFAQTAYNAFLGTANVYNQKMYKDFNGDIMEGLPFDSYSPLCFEARGVCTAGVAYFTPSVPFELYGCCVCNAPAAVGLIGNNFANHVDGKLYLNEYFLSKIYSPNTSINILGQYSEYGKAFINVNSTSDDNLMLLIPSWSFEPVIRINNEVKTPIPGTYFDAGKLKDIKTIELEMKPIIAKNYIGTKPYFKYGPYVLAIDEQTNPNIKDLTVLNFKNITANSFQQVNCAIDEFVRFKTMYNKNIELIFTNYSSAGRKCYKATGELTKLTVFVNERDE